MLQQHLATEAGLKVLHCFAAKYQVHLVQIPLPAEYRDHMLDAADTLNASAGSLKKQHN